MRSRLRIEFAPDARRTTWRTWALLLASALFLALGLQQAVRLESDWLRAETLLQSVDGRRDADTTIASTKLRPDPRQLVMVRDVHRVSRDLMTPWALLLSSLSSASTTDVALLSIEPSVAKRTVRLTAEARDAHAMLAYLTTLQHEPRLSSVLLVSHQVQSQAPGSPVRFQVQANWGDAP